MCKGPSIYDVRKIFGFFDPLPPCPHWATGLYYKIHATSLTLSAFPRPPSPPQCGRHKWKPPKSKLCLRGVIHHHFCYIMDEIQLLLCLAKHIQVGKERAPASSQPFSTVIKSPEAKAAVADEDATGIRASSLFAARSLSLHMRRFGCGSGMEEGGGSQRAEGTFFSVKVLCSRTQSVLKANGVY